MSEWQVLEADVLSSGTWLCRLPALPPQASNLTSLGLSFRNYNMGMRVTHDYYEGQVSKHLEHMQGKHCMSVVRVL